MAVTYTFVLKATNGYPFWSLRVQPQAGQEIFTVLVSCII